ENIWLRPHPLVCTAPAVHTGMTEPLQVSLAVIPNCCTVAQVGSVGLHPSPIAAVGQPVNTGLSVSTVQLYTTVLVVAVLNASDTTTVNVLITVQPLVESE